MSENNATAHSQSSDPNRSAPTISIPLRLQVSAETRARWMKMRSEAKIVEAKSDAEVERKCLDFADRLLKAMDARITAGSTSL